MRSIALTLLLELGLAFLIAEARPAQADPGKRLIIWGGGREPSDAVRLLEDFNVAMAERARHGDPPLELAKSFPMALDSSRISGLNAGFFVVALGLCSDEEADQLVKSLRKDSSEGGPHLRSVGWAPDGSAGQDLCPKLRPEAGDKLTEATQPKRDCLEKDPTLCVVSDPSGAVHLEWKHANSVARTGALPPPAHFKPGGVVGSDRFGSFSSFERFYRLQYWEESRSLDFDEKTWFGPEETTEGGEDAIVSSRHFSIVGQKQRVLVRSIYAYSLSGSTSCSENIDFSTENWNADCQHSCRTVRKKRKAPGSGEDQFECVPIGQFKPKGKVLFASGSAGGSPRPFELVPLHGTQPKKLPTMNVAWQPTKLSFEVQLTNPAAWPGTKANGSHLDVWLGREMLLPWVPRVVESPAEGVRHLLIDFDGDRPQVTIVYPLGNTAAKPKPLAGSLTRTDSGWRLQFDLDYADLIGGPRHLKGSRQAVAAFQENEILLFALTVTEGDGPKKEETVFSSSSVFHSAMPSAFNRLLLGERGQLPELNAAMFGLTP